MGALELIRGIAARTRTAVITGPAAAKLRGFHTLDRVRRVDLLLPGNGRVSTLYRASGNAVYRHGRVVPEHVRLHGEYRLTSTIMMAFDTCRYYSPLASLVVLESARFAQPEVSTSGLLELVETLPRAKGLRMFRKVIRQSCVTSQSALETLGRHALIEARIPELHSIRGQAPFSYYYIDGGKRNGRMDLLVNGFLCVELDGSDKYSGDFVTAEERHREKQLLDRGFMVLRANYREVLSGMLVHKVSRILRQYRYLGDDHSAGTLPPVIGDGEILRRQDWRPR